jgi:hypothetical protein
MWQPFCDSVAAEAPGKRDAASRKLVVAQLSSRDSDVQRISTPQNQTEV